MNEQAKLTEKQVFTFSVSNTDKQMSTDRKYI